MTLKTYISARISALRIKHARESRMARLARIMQQPPLRLPDEPRFPPNDAPPIVWQVFMGCTTAAKLANELGITVKTAHARLSRACQDGLLFRNGGRFQAKCLQRRDG